MNLSDEAKQQELGRAIAQGMNEIQAQKVQNQAREERRMKSMIRNAASKELFN